MAEKKYTEHLGLTQQSEEDFVDGEEISRSFKVLDQEVFSIREKTNNLKNEDHYYSNDYYTFPEKINSITYGEGKYVAAGEYNIYSSIDKRSWNISDSRSGISAAFGNGKYMAVVFYSGYYSLLTSPDGTGWTEIQILEDGVQSTRRINEIAYEDGKFVIIGDGGKIYTSDGTQITVQNSNTSVDIKSIAYGNGIFLAVGYKSTTSVLLKSVDAVTWEQIPLSLQFARNPYDKITFGNGVFVIKDSRRVYTTTDGIDLAAWSTPKPPTNGEICFADDKFFLSCKSGNFISKNGTEWIDIAKEFAGKISAIKYIKDEILGTTDTNKLIGVSKYTIDGIREDVDKLNSALDNIATEVKTVNNTFGYGTFSNGYVSIGKTVCVSFQVLLATNIAAGKVLCSGLPKPLSELAIINVYDSSASTYSRAKVTYDGAVYVETTHNSGASLLINGSYVAK
ncbi:hypothetical protein ACWTCY_12410 [Anaerostipes caccae]